MEVKVVYYATSHLFKTNNLMVPAFQPSSYSMEPKANSWLENKNDLGAEASRAAKVDRLLRKNRMPHRQLI